MDGLIGLLRKVVAAPLSGFAPVPEGTWQPRWRHLKRAFDRLLEIGVDLAPATYHDFVEQRT